MIIRQSAFGTSRRMLRGGLHCHTTRSDGEGAPDDVIRLQARQGFDFLALTDHRKYNYENFAPDAGLTIIPGMEFDNKFVSDHGFRTFHTVVIGPAREDGNAYEQDQVFESGTAANQEEYQKYLDEFHAAGNLTFYCHPQWSSTPARYFEKMRGNFAMEIYNTGCAKRVEMDCDAAYWDEILGQGIRIFGVATDDSHKMSDYGNAWVMVNAENDVNSILRALERGDFYSSCGPTINDFYVEDGVAHIECSPAAKIRFISDRHVNRVYRDPECAMTHAERGVSGEDFHYIRATVTDGEGNMAWTNPIFFESYDSLKG